MKKTMLAILAALALALGIGATTTTAQADVTPLVMHSTVRFTGIESGLPQTLKIRSTSARDGVTVSQALGTSKVNVSKTCPPKDRRIGWQNTAQGPTVHILAKNACFWPSQQDVYHITVWR